MTFSGGIQMNYWVNVKWVNVNNLLEGEGRMGREG